MKEFGAEEVNESGPKDKISRAANRKIRDRNQLWEDDYFSWRAQERKGRKEERPARQLPRILQITFPISTKIMEPEE